MAARMQVGGFAYPFLSAFAAQVDDLETLRVALANRHRLMVTPADEEDKDGLRRGLGLSMNNPEDAVLLAPIAVSIKGVADLEDGAIKYLQKYMANGPWGAWLASPKTKGVGAKQLARLLGETGDPCWHSGENRPRKVSELWSYCGYSVVEGAAPARRKGTQINWSTEARKRAWLIAGSCVKTGGGSYYREVYDKSRAHYADAVHTAVCVRCGPSGKPAQIDSPLNDGHKHGRALRAIAKELLRDLWVEARVHRGLTD
jgi:hypothetical protein